MLRFRVSVRPKKFPGVEGLGSGPEGRLKRMRKHVTALIRDERIETTYAQAQEARGYAEKLIQMAVRNGDTDQYTMEMADHWILEKDLIHKLFKVLVPRYSSFPAAATSLHKISGTFPGDGKPTGVLELKGNPWPSVRPQPRDTSPLLHNILLQEACHDYLAQRQASAPICPPSSASSAAAATPPTVEESSAPSSEHGSSVDPPSSPVGTSSSVDDRTSSR